MQTVPLERLEIERVLAQLHRHGDPLECHVASMASLAPIVEPYAAVWADHIYPRRDATDQLRWPNDWTPFVAAHYTALVRAASANHNFLRLSALCKSGLEGQFASAMLLQVHNAIGCYWDNLRCAIDSLRSAFEELPNGENANRKSISEPEMVIATHRDRYRLLPTTHDADAIDPNDILSWDETGGWRRQEQSLDTLRRQHRRHWEESLGWMGERWWQLFARLQDQSNDERQARAHANEEPTTPVDWPQPIDWPTVPYYPQILGPGVGM